MKFLYSFLPFLLSVAFAASLSREISSEERLRDHLSMFRHVLHGNNDLVMEGENFAKPPTFSTSSSEEISESENGENNEQEPLVSIQNLASAGSNRDKNKNDFIGVVPGIEPALATQARGSEFQILPVPTTANSQGGFPVGFKLPPELEVSRERKSVKKSRNNPTSTKRLHSDPLSSRKNLVPEELDLKALNDTIPNVASNSTANLDSQEQDNKKDQSFNASVEKKEMNPPNVSPSAILKISEGASLPTERTDFEDYFGDERMSSLLAEGLKRLLKNQSDFSAIFEFPQLSNLTTPIKTSTNDPTTITFTAITTTTTAGNFETPIPIPSKNSSILTVSDSNDNISEGRIERDFSQGRSILNSANDMTSRMRALPPDSGRPRKSKKPKKNVEPLNVTEAVELPKKLYLKELLDQSSSDSKEAPIKESTETEYTERSLDQIPGETKHKLKPGQQSLSDIRKIYFQSLERGKNEDLITYFQRIYPELHHLVGKAPGANGENTAPDSDIEKFLKSLSPEFSKLELDPSTPPSSVKNISSRDHVPPRVAITDSVVLDSNADLGVSEDLETENKHEKTLSNSFLSLTEPPEVEHGNVFSRISATFHKLTSSNSFQNPFHHSMTSEATNSAELYPSVIGAVIFALFLILF